MRSGLRKWSLPFRTRINGRWGERGWHREGRGGGETGKGEQSVRGRRGEGVLWLWKWENLPTPPT